MAIIPSTRDPASVEARLRLQMQKDALRPLAEDDSEPIASVDLYPSETIQEAVDFLQLSVRRSSFAMPWRFLMITLLRHQIDYPWYLPICEQNTRTAFGAERNTAARTKWTSNALEVTKMLMINLVATLFCTWCIT